MKILICGCAGFIGSNFTINYINNHPNDRVIGCDLLTYASNTKFLASIPIDSNFSFFQGDIADKNFVEYLFSQEQPDIIINFAAESHVDNSIVGPSLFVHSNILGTLLLLSASIKYNVKRFHQVSTDEVYGCMGLDSSHKFFESTLLNPRNPYAATKAAADHLVLSYYHTHNLPITISRCTNNYGPWQHPEKLIPKIILNSMKDHVIPIYGDGSNVRDWIYVSDHCSAIETIIFSGTAGEIYNVSASNEISNILLAKKVVRALNKSENLLRFVADRPGHDIRYSVDSSKLRLLGWAPKMSFDEGLQTTIEWYKNKR